ncbi:GTPase Era [Tepidiforma sp.]|uniref:GTPase Era n=1 Tax=Tepidiforma sp. TaxID=2682230 RepID=UPI00260DF0FF|nr:GTPase Era [Tepidiforma sp.]MCX7619091.1 GTPase Era [Tepidiforma sp.]
MSILGRPNAGKSTLLNALVGAKLAIVSDRPQTTRTLVQGVWTTTSAQVVFLDTPGIHDADTLYNRWMMESVAEALRDRDLLLLVIDSTRKVSPADERTVELIRKSGAPALAVFNKVDAVRPKSLLLPLIDQYRQWHSFEEYLPISALTGDGLGELREAILKRMPEGPAWYPADHLTDQPERFLAAEIIREKILHLTREEVPHSVAVTIDAWEDSPKLLRILATVHVERPGQKAIVLGAQGARLKEAGTAARLELEAVLGRKVYLELFVKVSEKWRENPRFLKELDWRSMRGADSGE